MSLEAKIKALKEKYSLEELRSIINFINNPISKLIAEKLLLEDNEIKKVVK